MASSTTTTASKGKTEKVRLREVFRARPDLWEARAEYLALADEEHKPWLTLKWVSQHAIESVADLGEEYFEVPSASQPGKTHTVRFDAAREMGPARWQCDCDARMLGGNPCTHIGAGVHYIHVIERSLTEVARVSQQRYLDWCEFQESRGW